MTEFDPQIHGPELSAYLDGELNAIERAAVERLVADSPAAGRELERLRAVSNSLHGLSRQAAPDALLASLREKGYRQVVNPESPLGPRLSNRIWKIRVWINTLATAAALGLVWIVGRAFVNTNSATGELARVPAGLSTAKPADGLDRIATGSAVIGGNSAPPGTPTAAGATGAPTIASLSEPTKISQDPSSKDALAAADATLRVTLGYEVAAGRIAGFLGGGDTALAATTPVCNVVVNTRSPEEYAAIQTWLADLSTAQAYAMTTSAEAHIEKSPPDSEFHQLQLPTFELEPVLTSLGDRVDPGVRIAIEFAPYPLIDAASQMTERNLEEAKSELRDAVADESERTGGRSIAAAGYAGSLRESTESANELRKKETAPAANEPRAGEAAPPAPAAAAAPPVLAERNQPSPEIRQTKKEPVVRGGGRTSTDDKNVTANSDADEAAGKPSAGADSGAKDRKDQTYKFRNDTPAGAPPASGAMSRGVLNEDAETSENLSTSSKVQNQLAIQNELNNAIQQQSQSIVPIPLRFALPQLQNRIASERVTVNLIVNRPPPASSQPASMPNR